MTKRLNRRDFMRLSAATAGGGLLAACVAPAAGPDDSGAGMAEEPIEIRLAEGSWVGPEGIAFWTDEIIPAFEEGHPGIEVTFENAESPDYSDKLYTQSVAGDAPDVMFVWGNVNYNLMQKGQFLQLDDYFESEDLEDFYPAKLDAHLLDGKLYGMPKYVSTAAMAYNKDILDEAGVEYPDGTWTWDDYQVAYEATTERDDSGDIVQWGKYVAQQYMEPYVWMNGGEWMNAPLFGTKCLLDSEGGYRGPQAQPRSDLRQQPGCADCRFDTGSRLAQCLLNREGGLRRISQLDSHKLYSRERLQLGIY